MFEVEHSNEIKRIHNSVQCAFDAKMNQNQTNQESKRKTVEKSKWKNYIQLQTKRACQTKFFFSILLMNFSM